MLASVSGGALLAPSPVRTARGPLTPQPAFVAARRLPPRSHERREADGTCGAWGLGREMAGGMLGDEDAHTFPKSSTISAGRPPA
ncbi:unnamed protein product [Urochloa humidicola]